MIVMKFGGSSVGTPHALRAAAEAVVRERGRRPVVVVSALFGVTDLLIRAGRCAELGDRKGAEEAYDAVSRKHEEMAEAFGMPEGVTALLEDGRRFLEGVLMLGELTPAGEARLLSYGERLSAPFMASALAEAGLEAEASDARDIITVTGNPRGGDVDFEATAERSKVLLGAARIPVVTGFIGSDAGGRTMLLGRGGSDYTASILAEALGAEEIVICKDVDGILSADPRVVEDAGLLPRISYDEAAEMSHFGAKVLHPKTMIPAVRAGIPIRIRNTFDHDAPGTLISAETDGSGPVVKSVTAFRRLSMVTLEGKGMAGIAGFAAHLFGIAGRIGVNIVMFTQASSEQTICLVVTDDDGSRLENALKDAYGGEMTSKDVDAIRVSRDVAAIAVVGDGMRGSRGVAAKVFGAVSEAGVNVLAIAQGSSERNISFIVEGHAAEAAVRGIHEAFHPAVARKEAYA